MKVLELEMERERAKISREGGEPHRRGLYPTIATGMSYGGGATVGGRLPFRGSSI